ILDNEVKELAALVTDHTNTVYEMQDKVARFPQAEQRLLTAIDNLKADRQHISKLPIDPETKMPVFKITIDGKEYTDRKEAAKAFETAALTLCKKPDTPVKIGEFQGFPLSVTLISNWKGGGMIADLRGAYPHTVKLGESFANNLKRMEKALYSIDYKIKDVQSELGRLRADMTEAQRILDEPFPMEQELKDMQERLKVLTEELNKAALEAKRNNPQRQKTCYFELAKLKKEAMKRRKQGKDKEKGQKQKPKGDTIDD
ncbi:MAG: hypothetical protein IJ736_03625, partial [Firmicutes bacterium]|nr:hypothetical protein [Bacillota bacterium]